MVWIDAYKLGSTVHHPQGDIEITPEFANAIVKNFRLLTSRGYHVTFLREHGRVDSFVYGDITDVRIKDGYVTCAVDMTRDEEKEAYNSGILREYSPGFSMNWTDPHTGEELGPVLLELSFTSQAYQKNLRIPQDINPGVVLSGHPFFTNSYGEKNMATKKVNLAAEELPEEVKLAEGEPTMADLLARIEALEAAAGPKEAEEVEMAYEDEEKDGEIAKLSAIVHSLQADKTRMELSAAGIKGDVVPSLVQLSRTDAKLYAATVKMLSSKPQPSIGTMGEVETTVHLSAADVAAEAVKAGKSGPGHLAVFVAEKFPSFEIKNVRAALNK
jgi:hypothetical protein